MDGNRFAQCSLLLHVSNSSLLFQIQGGGVVVVVVDGGVHFPLLSVHCMRQLCQFP